jgi:putative heme iron utilization protein
MAAVKTLAQELTDAKTAAKGDLNTALSGYSQANYSTANWTALTKVKTDGDTAIENAASITAVETAKTTAINAMAAVKTLAQELAAAKTAAINAINAMQWYRMIIRPSHRSS